VNSSKPKITFTDALVARVREILLSEGEESSMLRIFVQGGGCSGLQYGFSFECTMNEDDLSLKKGDVTFIVDPISHTYLVGATVDFHADHDPPFAINNPGVRTTCGCGSSFS
jgi:iron-sulfur cluster insertion protein